MVFAQTILPPANKADRKLPGGVNESIKSHKLAQKSDFSLLALVLVSVIY